MVTYFYFQVKKREFLISPQNVYIVGAWQARGKKLEETCLENGKDELENAYSQEL